MLDIVIDIAPNGRVSGMHRDEFNLNFLGKQTITRASELTHNPDSQRWEIRLPPASGAENTPTAQWPVIAQCGDFASYNEARDFEVSWMNECRKQGVEPGSERGLDIAAAYATYKRWRSATS